MNDSNIQITPLMRKFISDLKYNKPNADIELIQNDDGGLSFSNLATQGMWLGYQMGYKKASRNEPGWFFLAKATDSGMEISKNPRGNCNYGHHLPAIKRCERDFGGKFFAFTLSHAAYDFLKKHFKGNTNITFANSGEITSIPFTIRDNSNRGSVKPAITENVLFYTADPADPYVA